MRVHVWSVLIVLAALVILAAAPLPHVDSDAPLYGRIAANVLATDDWITFHHPGWLVDKPPVVFWLMAATFRLLGISDVTMRLWQLLLALGLLWITWAAARAAGGSREECLLAALILGTSIQFFYQATVPQQDIPLTFFLTLGVYGVLRYVDRGGLGWMMLAAVGVALAVLTKGIAAIALFGVVIAIALPVLRRALPRSGWRTAGHAALAGVVGAAIALPWFIHGALRFGEPFISTFLTTGTLGVGRFFRPAISTPPPYWLSVFAYVPMLALGMLPWTPALVVGLAGLPRRWRGASPRLKIVAIWFLATLAALSLSSGDKVFRYLLPSFPPAAILAARASTALLADTRRLRWAGWMALVPAVLLSVAGFWFLWAQFPPERGLLQAVVLPTVVALALGLIAFGGAALAGRGRLAIMTAAARAMIGYAFFEGNMLTHAAAINPWPAIRRAAVHHAMESSRLVLYGRAGEAFNFAHFYFDNPVITVGTARELAALWRQERLMIAVPIERYEELTALDPAPLVVYRNAAGLLLVANWTVSAR